MGIELIDIIKKFNQTTVIRGISLKIDTGEFVSLTGKSGSGKSTLLYIIATLDAPSSGSLILNGQPAETFSQKALHQFRNQHMGFIFQSHYLLPELTAIENVLMPTVKAGSYKASYKRAQELLEQVGLSDKHHQYPRQLSGGENQRVAIARALIMNPAFLFADEPTGSLDSSNGETVMQLFDDIHKAHKTTIVMVTHEPEFAKLADRQIVLKDGALYQSESV